MKPFVTAAVFAALLASASPCFALWTIAPVGKKETKEFGMQVRVTAAGSGRVTVRLEFRTDGVLKDFSGVEMRVGKVEAPLLVDRSKPGLASVAFAADRAYLDKITLSVSVPGEDGGAIYELRVKDFVEPKKD